MGETVQVQKDDLRVLASMECEHARNGQKSCDEADLQRGGCCNSCWARRMAKQYLGAER